MDESNCVGYEQGMHEGIAWGTSQGVLTMYQALKSKIDDPDVCHKVTTSRGVHADCHVAVGEGSRDSKRHFCFRCLRAQLQQIGSVQRD